MGRLVALWRDEAGVMPVETALIVALVSLACVGVWQHLAGTIDNQVADTRSEFEGR